MGVPSSTLGMFLLGTPYDNRFPILSRKPGHSPGARPRSFGTGLRIKPIPSLPQVLQSAHVPLAKDLSQLPAGELRMLRQTFSLAFEKQLQHPQRRITRAANRTKPKNP